MTSASFETADVSDPLAMRHAGPQVLSLALMDARNRTLQWLAALEGDIRVTPPPDIDPPVWLVGQAARLQELWISRNPQRARGQACSATGLRLASIDPVLDWWLDPVAQPRSQRWAGSAPAAAAMRAYLEATLETTLELLEKAAPDDDGLYFYRLALCHEDRLSEWLAATAQALGIAVDAVELRGSALPAPVPRAPIGFAAQRVVLGTPPGGFVPEAELGQQEVLVDAFEIDAQPLGWAQFAEFVADGGYDNPGWWSLGGWHWVEHSARRAPRYVEQWRQGVLVHRNGRLQRVPATQSAMHLSAFEAEAWCRWAGRRLPTEAEWVVAARAGAARGFAWGDVTEWVAGPPDRFAGYRSAPLRLEELAAQPEARVLRGASCMTVPRERHPGARHFQRPQHNLRFAGFRSCAI